MRRYEDLAVRRMSRICEDLAKLRRSGMFDRDSENPLESQLEAVFSGPAEAGTPTNAESDSPLESRLQAVFSGPAEAGTPTNAESDSPLESRLEAVFSGPAEAGTPTNARSPLRGGAVIPPSSTPPSQPSSPTADGPCLRAAGETGLWNVLLLISLSWLAGTGWSGEKSRSRTFPPQPKMSAPLSPLAKGEPVGVAPARPITGSAQFGGGRGETKHGASGGSLREYGVPVSERDSALGQRGGAYRVPDGNSLCRTGSPIKPIANERCQAPHQHRQTAQEKQSQRPRFRSCRIGRPPDGCPAGNLMGSTRPGYDKRLSGSVVSPGAVCNLKRSPKGVSIMALVSYVSNDEATDQIKPVFEGMEKKIGARAQYLPGAGALSRNASRRS